MTRALNAIFVPLLSLIAIGTFWPIESLVFNP